MTSPAPEKSVFQTLQKKKRGDARMDANDIITADLKERGMGDKAPQFLRQLSQESNTPQTRIIRNGNTLGVLNRTKEHEGILSIYSADNENEKGKNIFLIFSTLKVSGYKHIIVYLNNNDNGQMYATAGQKAGGQYTTQKSPRGGFVMDWRF
jgi:inorganic pyrophosphatase/exopolyphosphatase